MKRWVTPSLAALAIGVLALTMSAAPAKADAIDFNYLNGTIATGAGGVVTGTVNGTVTVSRNGTTVLCCFSIPATLTFTTGTFVSGNGTTSTPFTWNAGGSITVTTTGGTVNGVSLASSTLFSGSFAGPETAVVNGTTAGLNGMFVLGNINAALAAALKMPAGAYTGIMQNNLSITGFVNGVPATASLASGDLTVTPTPEPGTLALFGSGLLGIAGIARRYLLKSN
jgi:hypothetical protein